MTVYLGPSAVYLTAAAVYLGPGSVYLTPASGAAPVVPAISVTAPASSSTAYALSDVTVSWEATPSSGRTIASVTVHLGDPGAGGRLLATSASASGSAVVVPEWADAGSKTLYLRAIDDIGGVSDYATRTITVATYSETAPGPTTIGPFSDSNYESRTSAGSDLTVGNSLVALFDIVALSGTQALWCHNSTNTTGWLLQINSAGGVAISFLGGGSTYTLGYSSPGRMCVVLSRLSDNSLRVSLNGAAAALVNANPTMVANSAAAISRIGRYTSAGFGAANSRMIEIAHIGAEMTDADMVAVSGVVSSFATRNRLPDLVRNHANLTYRAHAEDYDSTTGVLIGRDNAGAQVVTWARTGTVVKTTDADLRVYPQQTHWWQDAALFTERNIAGTDIVQHNYGAGFNLSTDATRVEFRAITDIILSRADYGIAVDGAFQRTGQLQQSNMPTYIANSMAAGTKTVEAWDGLTTKPTGQSFVAGTHILGVAVPSDATFSIVRPVAPEKRAVVLGDSIAVGDSAYPASRDGWFVVARRTWDGRITVHGWGFNALSDHTCTSGSVDNAKVEATAQLIVSLLDGTLFNVFIVETMTNDYGVTQISHTLYGLALAALLDRVHVLKPSALGLVVVAPTRQTETANASGSTLPNFRTEAAGVVSARAAWCYSKPTMAADGGELTYPTHFSLTDYLHPNTAGHALLGAGMATWLNDND